MDKENLAGAKPSGAGGRLVALIPPELCHPKLTFCIGIKKTWLAPEGTVFARVIFLLATGAGQGWPSVPVSQGWREGTAGDRLVALIPYTTRIMLPETYTFCMGMKKTCLAPSLLQASPFQ